MSDTAYSGPQSVNSDASHFNAMAFFVSQMLGKLWTVTIGQVMACTNTGALAMAGTVDMQPMVSMVDGQGVQTPHGTIYGLPYFRLQGGVNAIIIDPAVGDIGMALFANRDISSVIANKAPAGPGSWRRFDPADGIYVGGVLNAVPTNFIQFQGNNITITGTGNVTINAGTIGLIGEVDVTGVLKVGGTTVTVP